MNDDGFDMESPQAFTDRLVGQLHGLMGAEDAAKQAQLTRAQQIRDAFTKVDMGKGTWARLLGVTATQASRWFNQAKHDDGEQVAPPLRRLPSRTALRLAQLLAAIQADGLDRDSATRACIFNFGKQDGGKR